MPSRSPGCRALAAHQGVAVFDLSDTFDQIDPTRLEIAAWDDHPNVLGHHRLFLALARALVKDPEVYRFLFYPEEQRRGGECFFALNKLDVRGQDDAPGPR